MTSPTLVAIPICRNTPRSPRESGLTSPPFHHPLRKLLPHSPQPESHISPKSASPTSAARKIRTMSCSPFMGCPGTASMRDLRLATSPLLLPLPDQRGLQTTAQRVEQNSLPAAPGRPLWVCPPTSTTRRLSREITDSGFKSCPSEGQTTLMNFS